MLIGNKCDLEEQRAVSKEEAEKFAADHGMTFFEVSAKTATRIDAAFIDSANKIYEKVKSGVDFGNNVGNLVK